MAKLNCKKCGNIHPSCPPGCGVVVESLKWITSSEELPDEGVTVLLFSEADGEPVWPGYFDEATANGYLWRSADGSEIENVTHWAEMPAGPGRG